MDLESFRSIVRTFHSVFPNMTLWRTGKSDCLLVGSKGRLAVDYKVLTQRMRTEAIASDLKRIDINTIPDYLGHLVMGQDGAKRFSQGAPIHTDDNALLEFSAPRALTREVYHWALVEAIEQYREADLSFLAASEHDAEALAAVKDQAARFIEGRGHVFQAHIYMNQDLRDQAIAELRKAAALNPGDGMLKEFNAARHKEAFHLAKRGQIRQAMNVYRTMLTILPNDEKAHYNLATLLKRQGKFEEAIAHYSDAVRLKPDYTYAYYNLGELAQRQGKVEEALKHYRRALLLMPELVPALNNLAWLLATYSDPVYRDVPAAIRLAEKACELTNNKGPLLLYTLSMAYAAAGRFSDAQATAKKALNLALATGNHRLAEKVRKQIKLYEGQ
jgi:tetratricopeptide (TPR) repeat protein